MYMKNNISYVFSFNNKTPVRHKLLCFIITYQQVIWIMTCPLFFNLSSQNDWCSQFFCCWPAFLSLFFFPPDIICGIIKISLCILSFPQGTDETLLGKLKQQHQDNPFLATSSNTELTFVIQHFAGTVKYHIKVEYIAQSTNFFILQSK